MTTSRVARNTLLNYTSSVFNLVNGVAISIIMARSLGPDRLGIYSNVSFVLGLGITICSFGIGPTIVKLLSEYAARLGSAGVARIVRLFVFGVSLPAMVAAIGVAVALHVSNHDERYAPVVILVASLAALPAYLAQIYRSVINGFQDFVFLLKLNLTAAVSLLTGVLLVAVVTPEVPAFLAAAMVPNVIVVAAVLWRYRGYLFGRIERVSLPSQQIAEIVSYLWPVALISVLDMVVWQYSEVLFLGAYRPPGEVAFYTVSFSLASLLLRSVAASVTAGFMPALSQLYGLGRHDQIRSAFYTGLRFGLLFTIPLTAMVAMVARPAVLLLYGEPYLESASYVPALVAAAGLGSISGIAADVMYSTRQQHTMLIVSASVAVLNLSLDALLIPSHGVPGAVIANAVSQAVCALATLGVLFARYRQSLPLRAYLGPLLSAGLILLATWPLALHLSGPVAIVAIGAAGVAAYLLGLRLFRVLSAGDSRLLASIAEHIPHLPTRRLLGGILRFCAPGHDSP